MESTRRVRGADARFFGSEQMGLKTTNKRKEKKDLGKLGGNHRGKIGYGQTRQTCKRQARIDERQCT